MSAIILYTPQTLDYAPKTWYLKRRLLDASAVCTDDRFPKCSSFMSDLFLAYDASKVLFSCFILFRISISLLSIRGMLIVSWNANTAKGHCYKSLASGIRCSTLIDWPLKFQSRMDTTLTADRSHVRDIIIPCIRLKGYTETTDNNTLV